MTWILKLARYNEITASILGLLLNFLLLYVVSTVKSKIGNISRILLQNCFMDMTLAIATLLAGVHTVSYDGTYFVIMGSYLNFLGFEYGSYFIAFFGAAVILSIQALPVPFYVRYQSLCRSQTITIKQFIFLYCAVFAGGIITFALMLWCYPPNEKIYESFKPATMTEFWLEEFPNGVVFVARKNTDFQMFWLYGFTFFTATVGYCLVLYFSIQITRHLRNHVSAFKHTKIQSKQLHWTLIAQAIGPLVVGNCPIFAIIVMVMCGIGNNYISLALSSTFGWVGVVNPLAALIIMSPYRNRIAEILRIRKEHSVTQINAQLPPTAISTSGMAV